MNNIFFISGFLGSGKTTLIKALVEFFSVGKIKSALIINEIGEIGIDNKYMKKLGYNIWELFGGCICCTLASGLIETMEQLKKYEPDVILIEPSGGADPKATLDTLMHAGIDRQKITNFFVLDATRLEMFTAVLLPLISSSITEADVVLINKAELAGSDVFDEAVKLVEGLSSDMPIIRTDKNNLVNEEVAGLIKNILGRQVVK